MTIGAINWRMALMAPLLAGLLAACSPSWQGRMPAETTPVLDDTALTARDGARLPVHRWLTDAADQKAVIVAIHGFAQYGGVFRYPGPALAERGISVYAVDLRGNGAAPEMGVWPEHELLIEDAQALVAEVQKAHPGTPVYVLGYSMGAALTLDAMTRPGSPPVNGLILTAPGLRSWQTLSPLERSAFWLAAHTAPWKELDSWALTPVVTDNQAFMTENMEDPLVQGDIRIDVFYGVVRFMDRAWSSLDRLNMPTLTLYGDKDLVIPCDLVERFNTELAAQERPGRVYAQYPNGYHLLLWDMEADKVLDDIASWIETPDAPLPSGLGRRLDAPVCPAPPAAS